MLSFEFPLAGRQGRLRPIIPVSLFVGSKRVETEALVDSGADRCMFSVSLAELLGIDLKGSVRSETRGVGGRVQTFLHPVDIILCGKTVRGVVAFSSLLTQYGLLGREPIFDEFDLHFRAREKKLVVTPV